MAGRPETALRAWSALLAAQALGVRRVEARLKAAGAPPLAWYDVLLELDRAGGRCRAGELAEKVVIEPYNMTRLLDRLEAEKLIRRERSADDRRSITVVLTGDGGSLRTQTWPVYRAAILDVLGGITEEEARALDAALRRVAVHLKQGEGD